MAKLPKQNLKLKDSEVERFYKMTSKQIIQVSFFLPRQFSGFDREIYPETSNLQPALNSGEWYSGQNKTPTLEDLESYSN